MDSLKHVLLGKYSRSHHLVYTTLVLAFLIVLEYIHTATAKEIENILQYIVNARTDIFVLQETEQGMGY